MDVVVKNRAAYICFTVFLRLCATSGQELAVDSDLCRDKTVPQTDFSTMVNVAVPNATFDGTIVPPNSFGGEVFNLTATTYFLSVGSHPFIYNYEFLELTATCDFTITVIEDIDECSPGQVNLCVTITSECVNTAGDYFCRCKSGYAGIIYIPSTGDSPTCVDIDECSPGQLHFCDTISSECVNTAGDYYCRCKSGYSGNIYFPSTGGSPTCVDIDECSPGQVNFCDTISSECVNTAGDYFCRCKSGYSGNIYFPSTGDSPTCVDIDECSPGQVDSCDTISSECMNTAGDYFCRCKSGYSGNIYFPSTGGSPTCVALSDIEDMSSDTSAPVYLISLIIIPVLLIAVIVVFIIKRKNTSKGKKATKAGDGDDSNYVNKAMANDCEDCIPREGHPRTVSSSKYEDFNLKPRGGVSIPGQYYTIVPEPQKPVAAPKYPIKNMHGVKSGASEDGGVISENRQLPDVPKSRPSGDKDEYTSYGVPDRLEEYTGLYINIKNKRKLVQTGPLKVAEFQNFMTRKKEAVVTDIVQQFMALPSGGKYPWSVALKFHNKPRNFFNNILAYDHSRVKLDTGGSDAKSDYINANYIKNQEGTTSFIAAQGPQKGTVGDFWKMVWQENVATIVMVTDNIEKNKNLCCTYWPNKVYTSEVFDDITVLLMESTSYTTHTIRKLNLLKTNRKAEVHTVTQVHVHSWQYGSVPKEPASLISIIKKVKSLQKDGSSCPMLVHCSNGVGATGTFIAVFVLVDIIKKDKDVNVFDFVKKMRDDRVNMVQTRIQYLFIFECLLAVLQSTDSEILCDQLKKLDQAALKLKSKKEYKILQESAIEKQHCEDSIGHSPENQHKNRVKNLIPVDKFRPALKSKGNTFGSNSCINAIHVTNFSGSYFIMTQTPLSSTVEDFWRLVYDIECKTIVMLNTVGGFNETVIQYWPSGGGVQYGLMTVECTSTTKSDVCVHRQLQVAHKNPGQKWVSVDHFAFCGWSGNQPDVSKLRQFIRYTGNKKGPVLVHCINGVGLSAVYVIVTMENERLQQEGSVDVFQCLTKLRKICPLAIQTQEEYTLCYQLLKDHLDNPEEYSVVY